jgi:RimJ/RimL family protein N-acetyltransferase
MYLLTPSSVLRDWTPDDIPALLKHADNPRIASRLRDCFPSPCAREDAKKFVALATEPGPRLFLAIVIGDGAVGGIGIILLSEVKRRTAGIGYWLSEDYWGRGIVTDAVNALVPVAFGQFDIVRLEAGIFSNNPALMRVMEKCGFTREAVHKKAVTKNGKLLDEVVYVRFADGWLDRFPLTLSSFTDDPVPHEGISLCPEPACDSHDRRVYGIVTCGTGRSDSCRNNAVIVRECNPKPHGYLDRIHDRL